MKAPEAFGIMSRQFFDGCEAYFTSLDALVAFAVRDLSKEQRSVVKQFIDQLLAMGDVERAQQVWWASEAVVWFSDEDLIKILGLIKTALD